MILYLIVTMVKGSKQKFRDFKIEEANSSTNKINSAFTFKPGGPIVPRLFRCIKLAKKIDWTSLH